MIDETLCGSKEKSGSGEPPYEEPNNLIAINRADITEVLAEGPILGLADGESSILLNGVPLKSPGESEYNFKGVGWGFRYGRRSQAGFKNASSVAFTENPNTEITKAVPIIHTIPKGDYDDLEVTFLVPSLFVVEEEDGDMVGTTVEIKIEIRQDGGAWVYVTTVKIQGKTNSSYSREVVIEDIKQYGDGPWDVRFTRLTDDHTKSNISDKTYLASYTVKINDKFSMPNTAAIRLRINAKQFGQSFPQRSYVLYGLSHVRVPSNMDDNGRYVGVWDGKWKYAWTDNPVWCLMEWLTNTVFGRGMRLSCIDKWTFYAVSKWCNQLVDDGNGGKRRRFRYTHFQTSQEKAYEIFNSVGACFFGMPIWGTNMVTLVCDMPQKARHIATPSNVEGGVFNYSGSAIQARPSVVYVTWNDPDDHFRPAVELVRDKELMRKYGWRKIDVVAPGCTNRHQAMCHGRWLLETVKSETSVVSFRGGEYFADAYVGSLVAVQDPYYSNVDWGGRCGPGCTRTSVVLDRSVTLASGAQYSILVDLPDGTNAERIVTNTPGTYSSLTIEALPTVNHVPVVGAQWVLQRTNLKPRMFRVTSHVEVEDGKYEITAAYHDPTKFDRIWGDKRIKDVGHSNFPSGPISAVSAITVTQFTHKSGNNYHRGVELSWEHIRDARVSFYDAQWKLGDGEWMLFGRTEENSCERRSVKPGTYSFRVRGRGVGIGPWFERSDVVITDPADYPPDVANLDTVDGSGVFYGSSCEIQWDDVVGLAGMPLGRLKHYRVRVYNKSDTLLRTSFVRDNRYVYGIDRNIEDTGGSPVGTLKFSVVAIDIYENVSVSAATLTATNSRPSMAGYTPSVTTHKGGISVDWSDWDAPVDMSKVRVFVDGSNPPTTARGMVASPGTSKQVNLDPTQGATLYVRLVPYDVFGIGTASTVATFTAKAVSVSVGVDLVRADGTTVVSEQDLFLDGLCARTITLTTGGEFRSAASGTRFQITKDYIRGLNSSNEEQVAIKASTGKFTAGEDEVVIDRTGISMLSPYSTSVADRNVLKWNDSGGYRVASIWADIGLPDGGGPNLQLTTAASINPSQINLNAQGSTGRIYLKINSRTVISAHPTTGLTIGSTSYRTYLDGYAVMLRKPIYADTTDDNSAVSIFGGGSANSGAGIVANGRSHSTYPGRLQLRFGGYDSTGEVRIVHIDSAGTANAKLVIDSSANVQIGGNRTLNGGANAIHISGGGSAPGSVTDYAQIYSADISAGACAIHVQSEDGGVIKLYPMSALADATNSTDVVTKFNNLLSMLRNRGYLST